jgi:hypothetical protein
MTMKTTFVKVKDMIELACSSKEREQYMKVASHYHLILLVVD